MKKQVLFFSHSSKDRDLILPIKNRIDEITGKTFDIFMSSDGQSIPFGRNWIHKVESGLENSTLMFVFVTESSISSGWIYFEAGFAYSKGIQVVPVGIGVDIGALKPPLSLLQGFNIISADSLNNFISIINTTFDVGFPESFSEKDYSEIMKCIVGEKMHNYKIQEIVSSSEFGMSQEVLTGDNSKVTYDIKSIYEKIKLYLDKNKIPYAIQNSQGNNTNIVFAGIKMVYHKKSEDQGVYRASSDRNRIDFSLSLYNFEKAFKILQEIITVSEYEFRYIRLYLDEEFDCVTSEEDISSIVNSTSDFRIDNNNPSNIISDTLNLQVAFFNKSNRKNMAVNKIILIRFSETNSAENIFLLLDKLYEIGIIRKNSSRQ